MCLFNSFAEESADGSIFVLIGAPGAGKGTQGHLLSEALSLPLVSLGSILRKIAEDNTAFANQIRDALSSGELVNEEILARVIGERTTKEDCEHGYIIDGHPRNLSHALWLDDWAIKQQKRLVAIFLAVPYDEINKRLSGRRICKNCGKVSNIHIESFKDNRGCDLCGCEFTFRNDDIPQVIDRRLKVFAKDTSPLVQFYKQKNQLVEVDGRGSVEEVFKRLRNALESYGQWIRVNEVE